MQNKKISDLLQEEKEVGWFQENIVANAPAIIAVFANFVVIFADYRVYDVIYQLTGSWWKALASSLACAVPFLLWEIGWQYNATTEGWRRVSLVMAGIAFLTSIVLGIADYIGMTSMAWANLLLGSVVVLTGLHTVVGLLYYYNDPDVARKRRKNHALGAMLDAQLNAQVTEQLLQEGEGLLQFTQRLGQKYDPEEVETIMNILRGKRRRGPNVSKRKPPKMQAARGYAHDVRQVENDNGQYEKSKEANFLPPSQ